MVLSCRVQIPTKHILDKLMKRRANKQYGVFSLEKTEEEK